MKKKKRSPSIYDVAKLAGVSPSTVSRFLNRTTFISKPKTIAIEDAIKALGYKPNFHMSQGSNTRSMTIGVLVQNPESPFTSRIFNDMESFLGPKGYSLVIASGYWQHSMQLQALEYLEKSNVDGVIVVAGSLTEQELTDYAKHIPVVAVGYSYAGERLKSVNIDNVLGGHMATLHLLQQGHVNIAHIKGLLNQPDAVARFVGYKKALNEAGIKIRNNLIKQGDFSSETGYEQTVQLIESKVHFSALFAANDQTAYGAIKALHDNGLRVPEDVSVVGFDDLPTSKFFTPGLTTLRQPVEEIGVVCAESILSLLTGDKCTARLPPIDLIVRESTVSKFRK
ncbi:TPA: substrate-binding domain-containing protein [Vibrio parahaemolyticus]|uniref:LacI family DNA-binding transcriptional regulator n=1 Tax=Vibrio TaxID=662 RepID=UPI0013725311|nr:MULTISPECIES: substrate-binding domain-containing protein [Vibrio]ELB2110084.1 substrate-binding domain-containing protein [Vibrio parahaemolyticus]ELB2201673.1 substrate-binding domain-containing protein [Vibrio parahaemolyticus]MCS0322457.1 substrate-binding domain-containing protein [Vibrio diabolicus]NAW83565.1 substrate-binding domain-containing protein [Vibrio sp. V43_P6S15P86]HBC3930951.1 substrate-binding domain-containing protein [Vibrio parahaemolyticus]